MTDSRPSPFEDAAPAPQRAAALDDRGVAAAALDDRSVAAANSKVAWQEAWEEASEAPLIAAALSGTVSFAQCYVNEAEEARSVKAAEAGGAWRGEVTRLLQLAVPIALTNLLGYVVNAVGVSFVGRLGGLQLSAAVLAQSIFNVTGQSIMAGLCGTIDTLAGQAYGARNFRALGAILQRGLLVNLAFGAAIALAWLRSGRLFLLLGQEAELSAVAARYMRFVAPALPCMGITEACRRFLLAQGIVRPSTVVTALLAALAPLYNWLFIVRLGLGLDGAAAALVAVQLTSLALMGSYVVYRNASLRGRPDSPWHGWSWAALQGWGQYLGLALPSVLMICCKWWSFEALILQAGWFPDAQLAVATMGLCSLTNSVTYMLLFGVSMSASVKISNALGAGCPRGARRATATALGLTLVVLAAMITALLLLRERWVRLLTDVQPVIDATVALLPVFCVSLVGDGVNVALQSLLRGAGKQKWGAGTNIVSYWFLAIPLAHHLAFDRGWGVAGLWWGIATANTVQAGIMGVIVARFDFEAAAAAAAARFALRQPLLGPAEAEESA